MQRWRGSPLSLGNWAVSTATAHGGGLKDRSLREALRANDEMPATLFWYSRVPWRRACRLDQAYPLTDGIVYIDARRGLL